MSRPSILDKKLITKLAQKLGKKNINIAKTVSARAARGGISPEVALLLFAKKNRIGIATALRKLEPYTKNEFRSALSDVTNPSSLPTRIRNGKKIPRKPFDANTDFSDPYLNSSIYSSLSATSLEAYSILFILENSLRSFVDRILSATYGSDWWQEITKKKAVSDIAKKVADRKNNEAQFWHHSKRGVHEIYYTDYSHLLQLIRSFDAEFSEYFKKGAAKNLHGKLDELAPSRNVVAHNNPITKNDLERLRVHAKDWIKYMQHLHKQKK